jgi:hypothetical protein
VRPFDWPNATPISSEKNIVEINQYNIRDQLEKANQKMYNIIIFGLRLLQGRSFLEKSKKCILPQDLAIQTIII